MRGLRGIVIGLGAAWLAAGGDVCAQPAPAPTTAPPASSNNQTPPSRYPRRPATAAPTSSYSRTPRTAPTGYGPTAATAPSRGGRYGPAATPYAPPAAGPATYPSRYPPPGRYPTAPSGPTYPRTPYAPPTYPSRPSYGPSRAAAPYAPPAPVPYPARPGYGPGPAAQPYPHPYAPPPRPSYAPPPPAPPRPMTMPGSHALPIDWPAAMAAARSFANTRALAGGRDFVANNRAAIDSLDVPFVMFDDPDLLANERLFAHGDFYTLSSSSHGMSVTLTGYARAYPLPAKAGDALPQGGLGGRIPADGVVVQQTEAGIDADFTRYGAVYGLAVECADDSDWRCSGEDYLRALLGRMAVVIPREGR